MILKPQDVLFLLKLVAIGHDDWSYNRLAVELGMSPSEVHAAARRALAAQLAVRLGERPQPQRRNLLEFLLHGIRYVFVPEWGEPTRGMPTLHAAPPVSEWLVPADELPPVWPDPEGKLRGIAFSPLYKSAPHAARQDERLYELLVLVDAIRGGQARERKLAGEALEKRLMAHD